MGNEGVFSEDEDEDEDEDEEKCDEDACESKDTAKKKMLEDSGNNLEIVIDKLLLPKQQNDQEAGKTSNEEEAGVAKFVRAVGVREGHE